MADMTATTMANWTPKVWSALATVTYRPATILIPLLDHSWEPELGVGRGDTINIPGFTQNNAAKNRGAGTGTFGTGAAITFDAVTEAQVQLVVNRLYYKAHRQAVESAAQFMPRYQVYLMEGQARAVALQEDADVAGDNTDGMDAFAIVGTDNIDVTEDDLLTCITNMDNQNAPRQDRYGVVSPATRSSILKIEGVRNSLYATALGGGMKLDATQGEFMGRWGGVDWYMSNNMEAGTAGKKNAVFQREAISYASQIRLRVEHTFNMQDGFFDQYATMHTCGFKMTKSAYGNELDGR